VKIGIIGAGTLGMTLGYRLAQSGEEVTVLESAAQEGGLATWHDYTDFTWDKYYHVILKQDQYLRDLIAELNLDSKLQWRETRTGFLWKGRLLSMSSNWEFLTFPLLSPWGKVRLALGILYAQRVNDPEPLERITASDWLTRVFGRKVYQRIWEPLLASKFGELRESVPATIIWATIRRYYSTRSKSDGKETLGFLTGGLKTFYAALRERIERSGGVIETNTPVRKVAIDGGGVNVELENETRRFDRVISTVPTHLLARLAPDANLGANTNTVRPKFLGVVCMSLVLRKPLTKFYVTNLIEPGLPFTGIIEVTALTGAGEMNGNHLVMLPRYDVPGSEWFKRPESEIAEEFLRALRKYFPKIDENLVEYHINRAPLVQALWVEKPPVQHDPAATRDGRLWSVNAELAGRDTLNNNAIVALANRAAECILGAGETRTDAKDCHALNLEAAMPVAK
jgi:protoporphyrinogen oxidase